MTVKFTGKIKRLEQELADRARGTRKESEDTGSFSFNKLQLNLCMPI